MEIIRGSITYLPTPARSMLRVRLRPPHFIQFRREPGAQGRDGGCAANWGAPGPISVSDRTPTPVS